MARARVGWEILPGRLWVRGIPKLRHIPPDVDLVVSCLRNPDWQLADALDQGRRYMSWPMSDGRKVPDVELLVRNLATIVRRNGKVVVHCRAGRNRSALVAALVVREVTGCSGREARQLVQERRPNSLYNRSFAEYLDSLPPPGKDGKLSTPQGGGIVSEPTQGDMLEEMRGLGLIDEDDADQPQLATSDPNATDVEQMEIQPKEADGRTWNGAEQLRPYLVRIEDLKPTEGNPFKGKAHVGRLKASLMRFGQVRAVLVDADDGQTIRAGHHLTLAAEDLGWTHVAAIAAEFNSRGEAIAYLMADNRLARVGDEDVDAVRQLTILEEIGETNLEGTGWDLDAVETLRSEAGATPVIVEAEPWGGAAAETAEEASARAKSLEGYEAHKEIPLYMTLPEHEVFTEHVRLLQNAWGLKGVMATILRALAECYEREAAPVGGAASEAAAPAAPPDTGAAAIPQEGKATGEERHGIEATADGTVVELPDAAGPDDEIPA